MPGNTPTLQLPYPTDDDTVDVPRDIKALADKLDPLGMVPVGAFMMWPTAIAPMNWLLMNGQQVDAASYPKLAALLGVVDNKVTIPNMADMFPVGAGPTMPLGVTGGASSVQLALAHMAAHNHGGATAPADRSLNHAHYLNGNSGVFIGVTPPIGNGNFMGLQNQPGGGGWWMGDTGVTSTNPTPDHLHGIAAEGGNVAHENRPPFRAINFIMRAG